MWKTLEPHLTYEDVAGVVPFGYDNAGKWIPIGINECLRFSRYREGSYFKSHTDGHVALGEDHRSIFTIMVYMNDKFTGGKTTFFDDDGNEILCVTPKTGMALIFNHGLKCFVNAMDASMFVVRSEIQFTIFKTSKIYELNVKQNKEKESPVEATHNLMCAEKSIPILPQLGLPKDLWIQLASYLDIKSIVRLQRLNKGFYDIFNDNALWHVIFKQFWPQLATLESKSTTNWRDEVKERHYLSKCFMILVLDVGFKYFKYGSLSHIHETYKTFS
uniref:F-box domain-containing protein n=1 Tax=Arcella intermedia TaxID=1963864 RepID=A0A6B2LBW9_9EUKA